MTLSAPFGGTCPIPFVPLGHFPLIRGIGPIGGGKGRSIERIPLAPPMGELARRSRD